MFDSAELGEIRRELYIDASPEIVFDVISMPEHVAQWWPDEADYEPRPGSTGSITFGDRGNGVKVQGFTVVDLDRPRSFSFRWTQPVGAQGAPGNSMLVTFELVPTGEGTTVKFVETGFRELGWDAAATESLFKDHVSGWNLFLPKLAPYTASLRSAS
ncbi:polyketide cyclase [Gryllotalpicola protaetiae]|uniref:Polyketide cyclase n=1 Tax=Gryllotalpicola protaetiae TaxID=2419771 RepID=A0A387BRH8_9MICO|nr:polyketide cyclase [Gryllotalpicola protaetiae]